MKALKYVSALLLTISSIGCIRTPGMPEPTIYTWLIISPTEAECVPLDICPVKRKLLKELIGYQAVSPKMAAKINNHHEEIHRELNNCKAK